jgi:hypothetical protein
MEILRDCNFVPKKDVPLLRILHINSYDTVRINKNTKFPRF